MQNNLFNLRDLIAYFIVAGIGFLIQLIAGSVLQDWFLLTYQEALYIGYVCAFIAGFFLTKLFAFNNRSPTNSKRQALKFTFVAIISCMITVYGALAIYDLSLDWLGPLQVELPTSSKNVNVNKLIAQITSMSLSFLSNYILHKKFTFANTGFYDRLKKLLRL